MAAPVPDDVAALKRALAAAELRADQAEAGAVRAEEKATRAEEKAALAVAEAAAAKADRAEDQALIAHLQLQIAKLKRERFGVTSVRSSRVLDQLELQLEELEASATEDELAAEKAVARATTTVKGFERKKPSRQPFPEHLPRERVVIEAPTACACAIRRCRSAATKRGACAGATGSWPPRDGVRSPCYRPRRAGAR